MKYVTVEISSADDHENSFTPIQFKKRSLRCIKKLWKPYRKKMQPIIMNQYSFSQPILRKEVTELEKYKEELPRKAIGLE